MLRPNSRGRRAAAPRRLVGSLVVSLNELRRRGRRKAFSVLAGGAFASFGRRSVIEPPVRIDRAGSIAIGCGVYVGPNCWLSVLPDAVSQVAIEIGDGTKIVGGVILSAAASVRIGRKVLIAQNVYVSDHSHAFAEPPRAVLEQGITDVAPVEICDGAWLGENVVVCSGVRIGRGAVIGANSVVKQDVPDYAVAAGAPARIVRTLSPAGRRPPPHSPSDPPAPLERDAAG